MWPPHCHLAKEIGSAWKIHMLASICAVLVMNISKLITAGAEHHMCLWLAYIK